MLYSRFTTQDVIGYLKAYYTTYGKHPSKSKWRVYALERQLPSYSTIETMFGGWRKALFAAEIPCNSCNPCATAHERAKEANKVCGKRGHRWKGGRRRNQDGYIIIYNPDWRTNGRRKYQFEHRLVMEQSVGRMLESDELVHHVNGIKDDNRPENLTILSRKTHYGNVCCPHCQKSFLIK